MESLFETWGKKNPEWEKKYEEILMQPYTEYGRGTSQYSVSRGKIFGAGYEMFIIGFFVGLYFNKTRKLPDDKAKRKHFGHPIMFWGSQEGKMKLGRSSYKKIQEYMFAALVAKSDIDFIALDKGEITVNDAAAILLGKMEEYANYGFHYLEEMLENDPNCLFKESAFLRIFTSFLNANEEDDEEPEDFEDDQIETFEEDEDVDEEEMQNEEDKIWTEHDIDKLKMFYEIKMEIDRIAEKLGKSIFSVQTQLANLGYIRMPLNVTVKNTEAGGTVCKKNGEVVYTDEAPLKIFHDRIYRFNMKSMCLTVKEIKKTDDGWEKSGKVLVAYQESALYSDLSSNFIEEIEDLVESDIREMTKIKAKGVWYDYYGDECKR